jgi:hypothetical protein
MVSKRITIMIPEEMLLELRVEQSKVIAKTNKSHSLSKTICEHIKLPKKKRSKKQ